MAPKKKGPFFFLMREIQNKLKQENKPCSMEDARVEASLVWESMTAEERAVYDNMAKDYRERGRGSLYNKFTSDGRPIALVLKEEEDRIRMEEELVRQVQNYVDERGSLKDVKTSKFYIISFNILCEANGVYFPLELGLVEYSIEQGCTSSFHKFIDSGPIPLGFASLAKDHSEDTHMIPITGFKEGDRDYQRVVKEMLSFLRLSPDDSLPPFFCTPAHMAQAEGCLRWLEERSCIPIDFPVWNIQTLLLKLRSVAGEPISNAEAQDILDCAVFDYETKSLCAFHAENDNKNCAIGESKRLAYKLSNALLKAYKVDKSIDYQHLPPKNDPDLSFEVSQLNLRPSRLVNRQYHPAPSVDQMNAPAPVQSSLPRETRRVEDYYGEQRASMGFLFCLSGPAVVYNVGSYKTTLVGEEACSMGEEDFPSLGDSMRTPAWGKPSKVGNIGCRPKSVPTKAAAPTGVPDGRSPRPSSQQAQQPRLAAQFMAPAGRSSGMGRGTDLGLAEPRVQMPRLPRTQPNVQLPRDPQLSLLAGRGGE
ncbi:unnamed protein product [Ixodes hexagonus]